MTTDKKTLEKIAHLARLHLDPSEEKDMLKSLNQILDWMDHLNEVDTEGIEPLTHMTEEVNVLRVDTPTNSLNREKALGCAPDTDNTFFKVPKVL